MTVLLILFQFYLRLIYFAPNFKLIPPFLRPTMVNLLLFSSICLLPLFCSGMISNKLTTLFPLIPLLSLLSWNSYRSPNRSFYLLFLVLPLNFSSYAVVAYLQNHHCQLPWPHPIYWTEGWRMAWVPRLQIVVTSLFDHNL